MWICENWGRFGKKQGGFGGENKVDLGKNQAD